ncbi:MAG TPA: hypothetical protein PK048_00105 [Candidatus Absconditabacterales bacterium]|nr:hypothetical protein [Candidatus Absconditabacterales bacterium]
MQRTRKATFLLVIALVYIMDIVLSGTMFGWLKTYAQPGSTDLISVFVEKSIYSSVQSSVDWYTKQYIGRNYDNPRVMLFVIDSESVTPADMVKINQNLYLEGTKEGPSKLVGTILIGDLRLPVVNKQGFIFPTVYPLVDFDQPKYYYEPTSDYFQYRDEGNSQPEIRHGVIDFDANVSAYQGFFDKLKRYIQDPQGWTNKALWYEDILHQKQTALVDNLSNYVNNTLFQEDIAYNRYTNLMVDTFNALHNSGIVDIFTGSTLSTTSLNDEYHNVPEFDEMKSTYSKQIEKFRNLVKSLKKIIGSSSSDKNDPEPSPSSLGDLPNSKFINTIFLQKVVEGFTKDYLELYGTSYFSSKEKRLALGGRYINVSKHETGTGDNFDYKTQSTKTGLVLGYADDHITLTTKHDEITNQLFLDLNTKIEKAIDDRIEVQGYSMNVILPTRINTEDSNMYEVYYFGLPAELARYASDLSIYRGTFNNIRSIPKLETFDYTSWLDYQPLSSVGVSKGENAREVEAHRGYDFSLVEYDQTEFERVKNTMPFKKHRKKRKTINRFISYYRAGYTPLNIDTESNDLRLNIARMDYTQLWNPFKDRSLGGWVFDIAGSRITTPDRVVGFTLGSNDEDDGDDDGDEEDIPSNLKSYSGYSDSFLAAGFFGSAIKVLRDNGKWIKVHKRKVRRNGKPRITNRSEIDLFALGEGSKDDGLFFLPSWGRIQNTTHPVPSDYITIQGRNEDHWNRFIRSVSSVFEHKSPTYEEMYGDFIHLDQVQLNVDMACQDLSEIEDPEGSCVGVIFKFTDIYPGTVQTQLYAKKGDDYIITGGKVLFNSTAQRHEWGKTISFDGLVGSLGNGNLTLDYRDKKRIFSNFGSNIVLKNTSDTTRLLSIPWIETTYPCELHNTDPEELGLQCKGVQFTINNQRMNPIDEKLFDIDPTGTLISFYPGASVLYQGKKLSLGGYKAVLNTGTRQAWFTGKQLQAGGINEFTLERPIDSPRYVNFQGIGGDKIVWVYPNIWKIPVYKDNQGQKTLMSISDIEQSISQYFKQQTQYYNQTLNEQYDKRYAFYYGNDGGLPRQHWIDKLQPHDRRISPLVQKDNTGLYLRPYELLPDDFLINQLSTIRQGKNVSVQDAIRSIARHLYYSNVMRQQLPFDTTNKILTQFSLIQSFADSNDKTRYILHNYMTVQPVASFDQVSSLEFAYPYYNTRGYEVGYINSDGSDYIQFETSPPLLKRIQQQKERAPRPTAKTKEDLQIGTCDHLIPPSYSVSLIKRPQAMKCWLQNEPLKQFEVGLTFVGSANEYFASGFKGGLEQLGDELLSPERQKAQKYAQSWRSLIKEQDPGVDPIKQRPLFKQLANLKTSFDVTTPFIDSGLTLTIQPKQDLGSYTINVLTTGSNCLIGQGGNLCEKKQLTINGTKSLILPYTLDPAKSQGVGDMIYQISLCDKPNQCIYRTLTITVLPGQLARIEFNTPVGNYIPPIARGSMLPLIIKGFDINNNQVSSSPFNFLVQTQQGGGLIYNNQMSTGFELSSFMDAGVLYDSFTVKGSSDSVYIKSAYNLIPVQQELKLDIVDPKIRISSSQTVFQLPEQTTDLEKKNGSRSIIDLNKLPKLSLTINDGKSIYGLVDIKSLGGKFIVGTKTRQSFINDVGKTEYIDGFGAIDQLIFTGGIVEFYLYPTMRAGDDSIQVKIGQTIETFTISAKPASAKKTLVTLPGTTLGMDSSMKGSIKVTDIRGNILPGPNRVLMGIVGNIAIEGVNGSGGLLDVQGEQDITITPIFPGGQAYLFSTIAGVSFDQQYPDYQALIVQNRSWPIENLSVAYLNLYGSNWSEQKDSQTNHFIGQTVLTQSPKTLSVTTQHNDLGRVYKSILALRDDRTLISFDGSSTVYDTTVVNNQRGYVTPYGWLPYEGGGLESLMDQWSKTIDSSRYRVVIQSIGQSSKGGLILQEIDQTLQDRELSTIPSIQHSDHAEYDIGFGDTFKPLTLFAQGKSVGQSAMPYASEFVINLGDPTYRQGEINRRIDHTLYDGGVGDVVFSDPDNLITQTMDIDRDRNGEKDLVVVYANGTIKILLAKGNREYAELLDVAFIDDGIKQVYVGDGDGDGYQDIFVQTLAYQLRFYKNYEGDRIDVDGYPICLNLGASSLGSGSQEPLNTNDVYQWMLTDPNDDNVTDIVVLDKNNTITLFYGGGGSTLFELGFGGGNYISRDKLGCDPGWKKRQENKSTIIKSFAPKVHGEHITDEALVHRQGLVSNGSVDETSSTIDPNDLEEPEKVIVAEPQLPDMGKKPTATQIKQAVSTIKNTLMEAANPIKNLENYVNTLNNTVTLGGSYRPVYEPDGTDEIAYKQLSAMVPSDPLIAYKVFTDLDGERLEDGDIVKVEITLESRGVGVATYIEKLNGPWEVPMSGGKQIGFFPGTLNSDYQYISSPGPSYLFMIDNLKPGKKTTFGYHVVFRSQQLVTIKHGQDFISKNGLKGSIGKLIDKAFAQDDPETPSWLEVDPLDGCAKFRWKILPSLGDSFREIKIDLQKIIDDMNKKTEEGFSSGLDAMVNNFIPREGEAIGDDIKEYVKEIWNQQGLLREDPTYSSLQYITNILEVAGNISLRENFKLGLFGSTIDEQLDLKIGELTRGLCEGFKLGQKSCSGIPILSNLPWNMAFLAPGDMQVMGCKIFNDKGLPLVWFPATLQTPVGPVPSVGPVGFKESTTDKFYRVGGGQYPSQLRIYIAPTLTAKLGIGLCFGPYGVGMKLPKLFRDVAGNCIVFAVDPGIGKCQIEKNKETGKYILSPEHKQLDGPICNDDITIKNSPLKFVETSINNTDNRLESIQGEHGLVIKLGGHANLTNYNSISLSNFFTKVRLEPGNPLNLKVKGSATEGLVSCLMNQFLDNQIRYTINNLTTFNLNIVLPDLAGLGQQTVGIGSILKSANQSDEMRLLKEQRNNILTNNTNLWSKQQLTKRLDTTLGNPFDQLATLFNDSELITISTKDVLIEIPRVYQEDIGTIKGIYTSWLERNKPIWEAWDQAKKDLINKCKDLNNEFDRSACTQGVDSMIDINNKLGQFERSVRQNIQTLELYGQLPKQVYELLHSFDSYIYDVFNFAYGTIDAVTSWLSKIARGFDARVDFIISLVGIIKTRQIIIDFSVNRKETCSKCTVDNYSAYSCSLSAFCPKLPVFAIPPFKIPSLTLDLSNVDFSTDIVIPKLRFQPKKVTLFDNLIQFGLPDTPYPPSMGGLIKGQISISLPSLPVIPQPPDLSALRLPSFIPQFIFKGPTLPPAPRIPKIAPELGLAIDIADFLGRVFCIIKGGIGLVGEKGLKSRIEQMTQRTRQVEPFDSLKLMIPNAPLQTWNLFKPNGYKGGSFDIKLETYAGVKLYFDGIYSLFDGVAQSLNLGTRAILRGGDQIPALTPINNAIQQAFDSVGNWYNETIDDTIETYDTHNIILDVKPFGSVQPLDEIPTATSDYSQINTKIAGDITYFIKHDSHPGNKQRALIAGDIQTSYKLPTRTSINTTGINYVKQQATMIRDELLKSNREQLDWVQQDYDGWIRHIAQTQYVSDDSLNHSLKASLLNIDPKTYKYLSSNNIPQQYVQTQQHVVGGYVQALKQSDYLTLGMSKSDYDQSLTYLTQLKENIDYTNNHLNHTILVDNQNNFITQVKNSDDSNTHNLLLSQIKKSGDNKPDFVGGYSTDPASHIDGYFTLGDDGNYHNVISSTTKGEGLSQTMLEKDLNNDKERELISWDGHTIYIKYAETKPIYKNNSSQVTVVEIDSVSDLQSKVDQYGYYNDVRIWSSLRMPVGWETVGQTYQAMTYQVDSELISHSGENIHERSMQGYIVRYADSTKTVLEKGSDYSYLLLLDTSLAGRTIDGINIDGKTIKLDDSEIRYIQADTSTVSVILNNLPRRWYFTQIAKVTMTSQSNSLFSFIPLFVSKPSSWIHKVSPWSLHETAGMQLIADSSAPYPTVGLMRDKKNTFAGQGDMLYGTIKSYYTLTGSWFDDSRVIRNRIVDEQGKVVASRDDDQIILSGLYTDKPITYTYQLVAEDAAGNRGFKTVRVQLDLPKLTLDDVVTNTIGQSQAISNLNSDVDTGTVKFIRIRNGVESVLQSALNKQSSFDTTTYQVTITGGVFAFKQDKGFYDAQGKFLGVSLTPEGQIINTNGSIRIGIDFIDHIPTITINQNNQELYRIYLKPRTMDGSNAITLLDGSYEVIKLPSSVGLLGSYSDGFCIKPKGGICEILVGPTGLINVVQPYHRSYTAQYGFEGGRVLYTLKKGGTSIATIAVEVEGVK